MSRYDDDTPRRGRGRDDDDRGSRRSRDDDRPSRSRDDDDRGSRRTASSSAARSYSYESRTQEQSRKRSEQGGNDFDKILNDRVKMWKPGPSNTIRLLPPTWKKPEHYGYDIYVHYGVGPDRGTYLCLNKMKGEACPVCEERVEAQRHGDEKYAKELEPKKRVLVYLVDRDHEKDGVQAWASPWTVDRDIVKVSTDRRSGAVMPIDHPDEGFDVMFDKKGEKDRTEYLGMSIDRRDSPLGKAEWLDFAVENPLPDQLQYFDYDHIAKVFNGGGGSKASKRRDDDDDPPARSSRGRDDDRPSRGRDRDDDAPRRSRDDDPTWDDVHAMTSSELDALAENEGVNPSKFDSDEALADAICDKMGIIKPVKRHAPARDDDDDRPARRSRDDDDAPPARRGRDDDDKPARSRGDDEGDEERLARMRRNRDDDPPKRSRDDADDDRPARRQRGD